VMKGMTQRVETKHAAASDSRSRRRKGKLRRKVGFAEISTMIRQNLFGRSDFFPCLF